MGCGDEKLSKYLTQTFTAHCNAMICQQVTLLGDAEWPKVADAVIEARHLLPFRLPQVSCSPQVQETPLSHHERAKETPCESYGLSFWLCRLLCRRGLLAYLCLQVWQIPGVAGTLA